MWYSFNYGMVHFVNIDTETDYANAPFEHQCNFFPCGGFGQQLSWLQADLAQVSAVCGVLPSV